MGPSNATVRQWLEMFAEAVRTRDYARGRDLFAPEAVGFGTVAERAVGLDRLVSEKWRRVWGATNGFAFDLDALLVGGDDPVYWAAAPWSSVGRTADGVDAERRGRATIVLVRRGEQLLAVHTHFSFVPSGAITPSSAEELSAIAAGAAAAAAPGSHR